jgi:hypothetical protein
MPLVLKLVGFTQDNKYYQIRDPFEGPINLTLLHDLFKHWNLSGEEIDKIKFITDSEQIKNADKSFNIKSDEDRLIFVFTSDKDVRTKLLTIFMKEGSEVEKIQKSSEEVSSEASIKESIKASIKASIKSSIKTSNHMEQELSHPDPEICKPITSKQVDTIPQLTSDLIEVMNVKSVSLFSDPDFRNLVGIYMRKPELFGTLSQYIQNGNVIEESLMPVKTVDQLTSEELEHYNGLVDKLKHLELGVSNEIIMNKLMKYSGHLNLTVRSILCDFAQNQ